MIDAGGYAAKGCAGRLRKPFRACGLKAGTIAALDTVASSLARPCNFTRTGLQRLADTATMNQTQAKREDKHILINSENTDEAVVDMLYRPITAALAGLLELAMWMIGLKCDDNRCRSAPALYNSMATVMFAFVAPRTVPRSPNPPARFPKTARMSTSIPGPHGGSDLSQCNGSFTHGLSGLSARLMHDTAQLGSPPGTISTHEPDRR